MPENEAKRCPERRKYQGHIIGIISEKGHNARRSPWSPNPGTNRRLLRYIFRALGKPAPC